MTADRRRRRGLGRRVREGLPAGRLASSGAASADPVTMPAGGGPGGV